MTPSISALCCPGTCLPCTGSAGTHTARLLLERALRLAGQLGREGFSLEVIDTNTAAIAFYEKAGLRRHSLTRVGYPKFREELKGMWRMEKKLSGSL
ncbi:MAG: GNAT family N-acetyltransferase [Bacteroidetes bacterium]|nr:GNAT family N-acetyltransferase [Bacteroidota bacterium]